MEVHEIQLEDTSELDAEVTEILEKIIPILDGRQTNVALNVLANLVLAGIVSSAKDQGIGCVGWAYRVVDQHAEHIKRGLADGWLDIIKDTLPGENPLKGAPTAGNC